LGGDPTFSWTAVGRWAVAGPLTGPSVVTGIRRDDAIQSAEVAFVLVSRFVGVCKRRRSCDCGRHGLRTQPRTPSTGAVLGHWLDATPGCWAKKCRRVCARSALTVGELEFVALCCDFSHRTARPTSQAKLQACVQLGGHVAVLQTKRTGVNFWRRGAAQVFGEALMTTLSTRRQLAT
jgi:hypothetical protein